MTKRGALQVWCLALACGFCFGPRCATGHASEAEFKDYKTISMVLTGSLSQVALAITNAFGNGAYHNKHLFVEPPSVTNRWDLAVPHNGWLPLTLVSMGRKMVAHLTFGASRECQFRSHSRTTVVATTSIRTHSHEAARCPNHRSPPNPAIPLPFTSHVSGAGPLEFVPCPSARWKASEPTRQEPQNGLSMSAMR